MGEKLTTKIMSTTTRRSFVHSAVTAGGMAVIGVPTLLLPRKSKADPIPDQGIIQQIILWSNDMYSSQWSDANGAATLSNYIDSFQSNLTSLGLDGQCGETIPGAINNYGLVTVSDPNFCSNTQQSLAAMGYNVPIDVVAAVVDSQPRVPQVTTVSDATSWNKLLSNHSFFMYKAAYALGYQPSAQGRILPLAGPNGTITKNQAEIAAVTGGVMAGEEPALFRPPASHMVPSLPPA